MAEIVTSANCMGRREKIRVYFRADWTGHGASAERRVPKLQIDLPELQARVGLVPETSAAIVAGRLVENLAEIEADLRSHDWLAAARFEDAVRDARKALAEFDRSAASD